MIEPPHRKPYDGSYPNNAYLKTSTPWCIDTSAKQPSNWQDEFDNAKASRRKQIKTLTKNNTNLAASIQQNNTLIATFRKEIQDIETKEEQWKRKQVLVDDDARKKLLRHKLARERKELLDQLARIDVREKMLAIEESTSPLTTPTKESQALQTSSEYVPSPISKSGRLLLERQNNHKNGGGGNDKLTIIRTKLRAASYRKGGVDWKKSFHDYDRDNSNYLDIDEFSRMIRKDGKMTRDMLSKDDVLFLFHTVDSDGGGQIECNEFVQWLTGAA